MKCLIICSKKKDCYGHGLSLTETHTNLIIAVKIMLLFASKQSLNIDWHCPSTCQNYDHLNYKHFQQQSMINFTQYLNIFHRLYEYSCWILLSWLCMCVHYFNIHHADDVRYMHVWQVLDGNPSTDLILFFMDGYPSSPLGWKIHPKAGILSSDGFPSWT